MDIDQQIKFLKKIDFFEGFEADEVVEREAPAKDAVQSTAKTRRDISEAVRNDPVFQEWK